MSRRMRSGARVLLAVVVLGHGAASTAAFAATASAPCTAAAPFNPCTPGGGPHATDCTAEWLVTPRPALSTTGAPRNRLVCYEGDPACDFDGDPTNRSCTFHAALCLNNADQRLA